MKLFIKSLWKICFFSNFFFQEKDCSQTSSFYSNERKIVFFLCVCMKQRLCYFWRKFFFFLEPSVFISHSFKKDALKTMLFSQKRCNKFGSYLLFFQKKSKNAQFFLLLSQKVACYLLSQKIFRASFHPPKYLNCYWEYVLIFFRH